MFFFLFTYVYYYICIIKQYILLVNKTIKYMYYG